MNSELAVRRSGASLHFATDDVAPGDRLAVWREVLGRVHLHLDVEPVAEGPLHATVESYRLGSASLYFSDTTAVRASRTSELVQDGDGDFRLLFARGAGYQYSANGADHVVDNGGTEAELDAQMDGVWAWIQSLPDTGSAEQLVTPAS
jgi:hypothetical protein